MKRSVRYYGFWSLATLALLPIIAAALVYAFILLFDDQTPKALGVWSLAVALLIWAEGRMRMIARGIREDYGEDLRRRR